MKKLTTLALLLTLIALLAACGSSLSTADGVGQMKDGIAALQKAVDAGDQATAKKQADALDETWDKFEDNVKKADKAVYGQIEDPLGALKSGTKNNPLDKDALNKSIQALTAALNQVK